MKIVIWKMYNIIPYYDFYKPNRSILSALNHKQKKYIWSMVQKCVHINIVVETYKVNISLINYRF